MEDSNLTEILPPELITEILLRVPVKSLLKFRSVSKFWLALISSREFIKNHLSLSASNHHVLISIQNRDCKWNFKECLFRSLFYDSVTEAFDLKYPIEDNSKLIDILGSCNGLILLMGYIGCLLLWNPTTRMHKKLPNPRPRWKNYYDDYGFGYDELRDDYKVVGIFYIQGRSHGSEVKIYSLKSNSWTNIDYCDEEILNTADSGRTMRLRDSGFLLMGSFIGIRLLLVLISMMCVSAAELFVLI
ncbi:F-box/kelch-repeat protein At3g06240-like [Solanum tuberosum]|uniref:F-box/kelch-repeat protein At3g06240-like n=1 Tax=Solanum tuberosum TaxID=4113 RepID=UPI0003D253C2|nr:PREDICTED: F-box/kelch-repeat protein At3g06240-like [Solanum tuberosum]